MAIHFPPMFPVLHFQIFFPTGDFSPPLALVQWFKTTASQTFHFQSAIKPAEL
jgi:hypothetical protein